MGIAFAASTGAAAMAAYSFALIQVSHHLVSRPKRTSVNFTVHCADLGLREYIHAPLRAVFGGRAGGVDPLCRGHAKLGALRRADRGRAAPAGLWIRPAQGTV